MVDTGAVQEAAARVAVAKAAARAAAVKAAAAMVPERWQCLLSAALVCP